ncbi:MAG TPA: hypothetical protein PLM81_12710, partial [Ginsengibacter sp.]|nr:hypothetical protein [Ginsengibacter sp.]
MYSIKVQIKKIITLRTSKREITYGDPVWGGLNQKASTLRVCGFYVRYLRTSKRGITYGDPFEGGLNQKSLHAARVRFLRPIPAHE